MASVPLYGFRAGVVQNQHAWLASEVARLTAELAEARREIERLKNLTAGEPDDGSHDEAEADEPRP